MRLHVYNTKKKANYLDPRIPRLWEAQLAHLILKTKVQQQPFMDCMHCSQATIVRLHS